MNLNYAIFRSQPIMTTHDLAQIGSHNQREKQAYNSNPDIRVEDSFKYIELVPLNSKYVKGFKDLTKEYEKQLKTKTLRSMMFEYQYINKNIIEIKYNQNIDGTFVYQIKEQDEYLAKIIAQKLQDFSKNKDDFNDD